MKTIKKTFVTLFILLFSSNLLAAPSKSCDALKADFTTLYITLQQSLNYEGKDAVYIKGRGIQLKKHEGGEYQGKLFEDMLFTQYQNSLKKVGALLIKNGKLANSDEVYKENDIISFFKSIDPNFDLTKYPDIDSLVNKLAEKSAETFKDDADKNKIINKEDKYLLAKLLIHAKDRICTVEKTKLKKGKVDQKIIDLANSPLNRMVQALKSANINGNETIQDIKNSDDILGEKTKVNSIKLNANGELESIIVEDNKAIKSAVLDNLHAFEKWINAHKSCLSFFKSNSGKLIPGVQSCNFQKFIDSIGNENNGLSDFEKILHFINANQKSKLKAETKLDPLKLENYIDSAIKTSTIPNCEKIGSTVFARNLKYNGKSFDPTENNFKCSKNGANIDCNKAIELVSDENGRGIQVRPKANNIKFSIPNSNCNDDLANSSSEESVRDDSGPTRPIGNDTLESCRKNDKAFDSENKKCKDPTDSELDEIKTSKNEECAKQDKVYDFDSKICRSPKDDEKDSLLTLRQNICKRDNKVYDDKTKSCKSESGPVIPDDRRDDGQPIVRSDDSTSEGRADSRAQSDEIKKCEKQSQKFDHTIKKCRPYSDDELKQELPKLKRNCLNQGKIFDEAKRECRPMTEEELKNNLQILKQNCLEQNKVFDEVKKECRPMTDDEMKNNLPFLKQNCLNQNKVFDEAKKECRPMNEEELRNNLQILKDNCKKENKIYDESKKECRELTAEEKAAEAKKAECAKDNKDYDEASKSCKDKAKPANEAEAECEKKNKEAMEANNGRPSSDWIVEGGKCINKKDKKDGKSGKGGNDGDNPKDSFQDFLNSLGSQSGQQAPRFQPTNIPSRQVYIMPGMP